MAGRCWTTQEDRVIRRMARSASSAEIGAALSRSSNAVKHRARVLRISLLKSGESHPGARYSDTAIENARTLHDQGFGPKWIASRLGINENTLKSALYYQQRRMRG